MRTVPGMLKSIVSVPVLDVSLLTSRMACLSDPGTGLLSSPLSAAVVTKNVLSKVLSSNTSHWGQKLRIPLRTVRRQMQRENRVSVMALSSSMGCNRRRWSRSGGSTAVCGANPGWARKPSRPSSVGWDTVCRKMSRARKQFF